jgi:endonuclease/exonuclease/phosphatase family metal-dependent hydrolase
MSAIVRVGAHRSEVSRKASDHFPIKAYLSIERRHREGAV